MRDHFNQYCTFVIKKYIFDRGAALLWPFINGGKADKISNEDWWNGTSKATERHLVQVLWAKEEGFHRKVNWQDPESLSAKGFHIH